MEDVGEFITESEHTVVMAAATVVTLEDVGSGWICTYFEDRIDRIF